MRFVDTNVLLYVASTVPAEETKAGLAEARAREFGIPEVVTDHETVLSRSDIDVVDIVTRGDHQELVFQALAAGKHVLVEKPVCHDYKDVW